MYEPLIQGEENSARRHFRLVIVKKIFKMQNRGAIELAAKNDKGQIVLGLEPIDHYWFVLATWMIVNSISVIQVNPYAVKQTKELENNGQMKDDRKDPKLIVNLVNDGNYGMPIFQRAYTQICACSQCPRTSLPKIESEISIGGTEKRKSIFQNIWMNLEK